MPTKRARFGFERARWLAPFGLERATMRAVRAVCPRPEFAESVRQIAEGYRLDAAERRSQPSLREVELALATMAADLARAAAGEGGLALRVALWQRAEGLPALAGAFLADAAIAAGLRELPTRELAELDGPALGGLARVYAAAATAAAARKSKGAQRGAWPELHAAHKLRDLFARHGLPFADGRRFVAAPALDVLALFIPRGRASLAGYARAVARERARPEVG